MNSDFIGHIKFASGKNNVRKMENKRETDMINNLLCYRKQSIIGSAA